MFLKKQFILSTFLLMTSATSYGATIYLTKDANLVDPEVQVRSTLYGRKPSVQVERYKDFYLRVFAASFEDYKQTHLNEVDFFQNQYAKEAFREEFRKAVDPDSGYTSDEEYKARDTKNSQWKTQNKNNFDFFSDFVLRQPQILRKSQAEMFKNISADQFLPLSLGFPYPLLRTATHAPVGNAEFAQKNIDTIGIALTGNSIWKDGKWKDSPCRLGFSLVRLKKPVSIEELENAIVTIIGIESSDQTFEVNTAGFEHRDVVQVFFQVQKGELVGEDLIPGETISDMQKIQ